MKLSIGKRELELGGKYLGVLRDSTHLMGDMSALRARMAEDGYLLIRRLHDRNKVKEDRRVVLENLDSADDIVYMGRGTQNVYTVWTPLGDLPYEMGPLAVLAGSHRFERIKETYGQMDVDRDHVTGWFSNEPVELVDTYGGQWRTTEFAMGDALIFGMFTMHGSLNNTTDTFRLSCDTRYQRADEPVDERWIGENPKAHYAWFQGETVPMEEARKRWGI